MKAQLKSTKFRVVSVTRLKGFSPRSQECNSTRKFFNARNAREIYLIDFKKIFQNWFGKRRRKRRKKPIDCKDCSKISRSKI